MSFKTLQIKTRSKGVTEIMMSRPEVFNAFDETMIEELQEAFLKANEDSSLRAIILSGSGKHFSAGADLQWMQRASNASEEWNLQDARKFATMLQTIEQSHLPTIAKIQGAALGGGVGLTLACDIAIASEDANFSISEAKFGILPSVIGPYLINGVGKRQAKRLALTTAKISAIEALAINLVHQVCAKDDLDAAIDQVVRDLLKSGPNSIIEIKALFSELSIGPITPEVIELTAKTISRVRSTVEAKEGFDAFMSKRDAKWIPQ
jgi:methylglutaconyl-CoA hydratase